MAGNLWLVRDATGEADHVPPGGRAVEVLDVSGGERSSEIGMQHLSSFLSDGASSERELACREF
jgi:hypothetical protein